MLDYKIILNYATPSILFGLFSFNVSQKSNGTFSVNRKIFYKFTQNEIFIYPITSIVTLGQNLDVFPLCFFRHCIASLLFSRLKASRFGNTIYWEMSQRLIIHGLKLSRFGDIYFWAIRIFNP